MDHSVTKCNLQTEMSSIKSPQKLLTKDTSSNQNLTDVDNSDEDSDIGLPINSNPNKLLSDLRVNLRIAMLKQAKILNQSFKTVSSNKVIVNNKSDLNKMTPQIKQAFSIKSKHLQSNLTKVIKNPNGKNTSIDIEMTDLDDLEKQNSDILKIAKNDTLKTDKLHSVILTEVRSPVKKQLLPANSNDEKVYVVSETQFKRNVKIVSPTAATSVLNQTLFVRKPLNLTTIMNVVESDVNKLPKLVSVRSLERSVRSEVFPFIIPKPKSNMIL